MFKKKQVLIVVSIAIICFLMGTMFNVMANDSGGSPWDKIWTAISGFESKVDSLNASLIDLQDRVSTIEAEANQVKTIRFVEPEETIIPSVAFIDGAIFVWTPSDSTNNAILSIHCYFQYIADADETRGIKFKLVVNGETSSTEEYGGLVSSTYKWSSVFRQQHAYGGDGGLRVRLFPNQNSYTIKFQFAKKYESNHGVNAYVKNINMILTVIDGLPASNP